MAKTYECERVELDFVDSAPFRFVSKVDLAITPEQLFEVLADAESWPHWASVITNVEWTSPEPRGVGTTRTVSMRGGIVGDEEFLAWEPFSHMAFRFNQSTSNAISAFAEDYRVVETPDGCHLTWVMVMKPNGLAGKLGLTVGQPVMAWLFQRFLHNLRRYTDARFTDPVSTDPPTPTA
ncbi:MULTISPECIES: SRPBCC family protein [unclassified Mycobacterium]|uniref:SRPBCC family protein n=1 Tax=unclassified Mycobacterium TaxID=2642494 RepID=UPI0029C60B63|nr:MULTISPECIES: SRPBCC family protein [unclassified Mycobacterium]